MGGGEEHQIAGRQPIYVRHREGYIVVAAQVGIEIGDRNALLGAGGDHLDPRLRMVGQKPQQLDTGITGSADDTYLDHIPPLIRM